MTKYPKNCSLRMADGGVITRWAQNIMRPTQTRLRAADAPAPAPAPVVAAPPVQTAAPVTAENPAGIRFRNGGDLRTGHGGHVPGSGSGDKIDAKYEPGEFVVSNDMLDNAPGLREQLHSLRDEVLADKGTTPEEADAKSLRGFALHARMGYDSLGNPTGAEDELPQGSNGQGVSATRPANAGIGPGASSGSGSLRSAADVSGLNLTSGFFPGSRAVGRGFTEDAADALRQPDVPAKLGGLARAAAKGVFAAPLGLAEDILEPAVRALTPVTTGAVNAANTAITGDFKPLIPGSSSPPLRTGAQAQPTLAPTAPAAPGTMIAGDATMPGQDPNRVTLRGQSGTNVDGAPGVSKFTQNGKTLYSNVAGPDNDKLMSNRPGVSVVPGMSREAIDASLGGMSASQVSGDNAIRAANLRDGVDMERGTSGEVAGRAAAEMQRLASSPLGTPGRSFAQKQIIAEAEQKTLRRGQDITAGTSLSNSQTTARTAAATARLDQVNKDRTYSMDVAKFGEEKAKANFDQRERAEKSLNAEISGMLPPGADGKPDLANAARYATALNADLAARLSGLERDAKAGKPRAAAALADYNKNGHASLDEGYKRNFISGMAAKDLAEQYSSGRFNPTGGRAVIDDRPVTSMRRTSDGFLGFGGEYTTNRGDTIPARAVEKDGSVFGGRTRNDLRNLIQK